MAEGHVAADAAPPITTDDAWAAVSGSGHSSGTAGRGSGQTLPLNSRRLTMSLLRQLAAGLGVPSTASQGDLHPMIEGKLSDGGHDPLRTQVVLCEVERGTLVCLRDESGVFREIEPPEPDDLEDSPHSSSAERDGDESEL